jgi:hypothetical protein
MVHNENPLDESVTRCVETNVSGAPLPVVVGKSALKVSTNPSG